MGLEIWIVRHIFQVQRLKDSLVFCLIKMLNISLVIQVERKGEKNRKRYEGGPHKLAGTVNAVT
jgi:hypothetical protein